MIVAEIRAMASVRNTVPGIPSLGVVKTALNSTPVGTRGCWQRIKSRQSWGSVGRLPGGFYRRPQKAESRMTAGARKGAVHRGTVVFYHEISVMIVPPFLQQFPT